MIYMALLQNLLSFHFCFLAAVCSWDPHDGDPFHNVFLTPSCTHAFRRLVAEYGSSLSMKS